MQRAFCGKLRLNCEEQILYLVKRKMSNIQETGFDTFIKSFVKDPKFRKAIAFPTFRDYKEFILVLRGTSDESETFQWKVRRKFRLGKDREECVVLDKSTGKKNPAPETFSSGFTGVS